MAVTALTQAAGIGTGVLVARLLGPSARGDLAVIMAVVAGATTLMSAGLAESLTFFGRQVHSRRATRISIASAAVQGVAAAACVALILALYEAISVPVWPVVLFSVGTLLGTYQVALLLSRQRFAWAVPLRLVAPASTFSLLLVVWFSPRGRLDEVAAFSFYAVSAGLAALVAVWARRAAGVEPATGDLASASLSRIWRYGLTSHVGSISDVLARRLDLLLLPIFVDARNVGYYAVALTFLAPTVSLGEALAPVFFARAVGGSGAGRQRAPWAVIVASAGVAGLVASTAWVTVPFLFGEEFAPAVPLVAWLSLAGVSLSGARAQAAVRRGKGDVAAASRAEVVGLLLQGAFLLALGASLGTGAAVIATTLGYGSTFLMLIAGRRSTSTSGASVDEAGRP